MQISGGRGNSRGRGSSRGRGGWQNRGSSNSGIVCHYCGKTGHIAAQCYAKRDDIRSGKLQQGNYASSSQQNEDRKEHLFVMQHMMNAVTEKGTQDDVWYVDSGASNHMTSHDEWFGEMQDLQNPGYVQTGDDSCHPITHIGKVPLALHDGKTKSLSDVLHVPSITKNLVSVGQMVEQGLQVRFNAKGCFVEDFNDKCRLVAKGSRIGRMFTLDAGIPAMNAAMYAKGKGVVADIDIWHKRIGHANVQRLKLMQSKGLVKGLPTFKVAEFHKICEACQFGKQARQPFSHDRDVSRNILDVVHTDVWGPTQNVSLMVANISSRLLMTVQGSCGCIL